MVKHEDVTSEQRVPSLTCVKVTPVAPDKLSKSMYKRSVPEHVSCHTVTMSNAAAALTPTAKAAQQRDHALILPPFHSKSNTGKAMTRCAYSVGFCVR
jgi:hypothetical protein